MLELRNIHKYYNPGTVNEMCLFEDFNLTINQGEFVSVVGSNGSGKTSMLNIICGSIPVESGQILIDGKDITRVKEYKRNQKIGRVYQNPSMGTCPSMTILENMSLADNKGRFYGLGRERIRHVLIITENSSPSLVLDWKISFMSKSDHFPEDSARRWHC